MEKNKTVLEKIGITQKVVKEWKRKGLKITYPMKERKNFFRSKDGKIWVETADKFLVPLSKKEIALYKRNPQKFREDFLKNLKIFKEFLDWLYFQTKKAQKILKKEEKIPGFLSLLYLFMSAVDHHYYHFDRYLSYENYPQTPVGFWWQKLKKLFEKAKKEKVSSRKIPEDFLKLLAEDKKVIKEIKKKLSKKEQKELQKALRAIKIFEKIQQEEVEVLMDIKGKRVNICFRTVLPIWKNLLEAIEEFPHGVKKEFLAKVKKILKGNPVYGTRKILCLSGLNLFKKEIISEFKKEIQRWL